MTDAPGVAYFPSYLAATLPLVVLVLVAGWLVVAVGDVARVRDAGRTRSHLIVLAWLVIPLVGIMLSPVRQDGVRYVMPCVVALAVMAAIVVDRIAAMWRDRRAFFALACALVTYLAITLVHAAPYYLDYFGEHAGSAGAIARARMFETAWWGEGLDRAIHYVNAHAAPGARVYRECLAPVGHLGWFREDLWPALVRTPAEAEWIVVYAPATHRCPVPPGMAVVFEVEHDGATLAAVYRR
jgi:hypothetical protein